MKTLVDIKYEEKFRLSRSGKDPYGEADHQ